MIQRKEYSQEEIKSEEQQLNNLLESIGRMKENLKKTDEHMEKEKIDREIQRAYYSAGRMMVKLNHMKNSW